MHTEENCIKCDNTGMCKIANDEEEFDYWYDKYDHMGTFSMDECYHKAMEKAGYEIIPCPYCKAGKDRMKPVNPI